MTEPPIENSEGRACATCRFWRLQAIRDESDWHAAECHQSSQRCPMTLVVAGICPPRSLKTGVGVGFSHFQRRKYCVHKATSRWAHLFKTTGFYLNYFYYQSCFFYFSQSPVELLEKIFVEPALAWSNHSA